MTHRLLYAAAGFVAGIFTAPIAILAWPFAFAWVMWNETDDD